MSKNHTSNCCATCCPTCDHELEAREMEFVDDTTHFFTRYECPKCEHGCYLVFETDDVTITYNCCYCQHQQ